MLFDRVENLLGEPKYRYHHVIWLHGRIRDPPKIFIDETFLFLFFSFLFFFYFFFEMSTSDKNFRTLLLYKNVSMLILKDFKKCLCKHEKNN